MQIYKLTIKSEDRKPVSTGIFFLNSLKKFLNPRGKFEAKTAEHLKT